MRRGIDTNVLVYTHIPSLPDHAPVREFLLHALKSPEVVLVVTPLVLHEFVHVVTDERRFQPPVPMPEAIATARLYLERSNVECISCDESSMVKALELLENFGLGRKRVADTLFAATLLTHGVSELITCNVADFKIFSELTLIDPRLPLRPEIPEQP
jgi:predicted nucleic acid-binding protein